MSKEQLTRLIMAVRDDIEDFVNGTGDYAEDGYPNDGPGDWVSEQMDIAVTTEMQRPWKPYKFSVTVTTGGPRIWVDFHRNGRWTIQGTWGTEQDYWIGEDDDRMGVFDYLLEHWKVNISD